MSRWGSTYTMTNRLLEAENVCRIAVQHGNTDLELSGEEWNGLEKIKETLEPAIIATKNLQTKNMTLPDIRKKLIWPILKRQN